MHEVVDEGVGVCVLLVVDDAVGVWVTDDEGLLVGLGVPVEVEDGVGVGLCCG